VKTISQSLSDLIPQKTDGDGGFGNPCFSKAINDVIDHGAIGKRKKGFRKPLGQRSKASPFTAGENHCFQILSPLFP
jgi:hypothetical protein